MLEIQEETKLESRIISRMLGDLSARKASGLITERASRTDSFYEVLFGPERSLSIRLWVHYGEVADVPEITIEYGYGTFKRLERDGEGRVKIS